jgi:hypothetical protein
MHLLRRCLLSKRLAMSQGCYQLTTFPIVLLIRISPSPNGALTLKTKYADLLEYTFEERDPNWGDGSTPYATCNDEYVYCNSIVQIKIKAEYLGTTQDSSGTEQAVPDRTIAYIFQDNRSLSQLGQTKARYWTDDAFTTEFGDQATLIFEQVSAAGVDELGKAQCPADLKLYFNSKGPCEDIFMSIYTFDASKAES